MRCRYKRKKAEIESSFNQQIEDLKSKGLSKEGSTYFAWILFIEQNFSLLQNTNDNWTRKPANFVEQSICSMKKFEMFKFFLFKRIKSRSKNSKKCVFLENFVVFCFVFFQSFERTRIEFRCCFDSSSRDVVERQSTDEIERRTIFSKTYST